MSDDLDASAAPGDGAAPTDAAATDRAAADAMALPPQKRAFAWWPAALTDIDFAPAWPRIAALAGAAVLGITIGLVGTRHAHRGDLDIWCAWRPPTMANNVLRSRCGIPAMTMLTMDMPERSSRWLLIGSLALNLFFIGTIGALAVRHMFAPAQPTATERPRTAAARIERLAAPLPPADAEKLRAAFRGAGGAPRRQRAKR